MISDVLNPAPQKPTLKKPAPQRNRKQEVKTEMGEVKATARATTETRRDTA